MSVVNEHPPPRYEEQVVIPETQPPQAGDEDEILVRGAFDWWAFLFTYCGINSRLFASILLLPWLPLFCLKCCTVPCVWKLTLTRSGLQYTYNKTYSCRVKTIFIPLEDITDVYTQDGRITVKMAPSPRGSVKGDVEIEYVSNVVEFVAVVRREMGLSDP